VWSHFMNTLTEREDPGFLMKFSWGVTLVLGLVCRRKRP
jgi:hypothetical protein